MKKDSTRTLNPTTSSERIEMVDSLRGFALAGVCLANLGVFSFYYMIDNAQKANLPLPVLNSIIGYIIYFFVDAKFWTLFSIMFGFGASIFISRADGLHKNGKALYARRLSILLIIGLIHGIFLWNGDILVDYALAGFILLIFSNKKGVSLAIWGIILGAFISLIIRLSQVKFLPGTHELITSIDPMAMKAYATGSYCKYLSFNLTSLKIWRLYAWAVLIAALGRFMIGYWIGQTGRMYNIENYTAFFRKAMRICAWIGFSVMLITTVNSILLDTEVFSSKSDWKLVHYLLFPGSLALGIFYAIKFAFLYQNDKWKKRLSVFKELGRMALTNYLMQTVINSIIFNGIGFGLAGKTGPSIYILWFAVLITLQIIFSKWWLSKYRFGPVEWLWRSLTYKKWQVMKVASKY
jgi:uncharacterized protein